MVDGKKRVEWIPEDWVQEIRHLVEQGRLWLPWIRKRFRLDARTEKKLLSISPPTMDRQLKSKKESMRKRLYGRTKPGSLLRHQIPIKTSNMALH